MIYITKKFWGTSNNLASVPKTSNKFKKSAVSGHGTREIRGVPAVHLGELPAEEGCDLQEIILSTLVKWSQNL